MTYQDLMEWVESDPFVPFRLHLTDGRFLEIQHASLIWPGKRTVMVGYPDDPTEPEIPARHKTIDLVHIVSIEPLSLSPTS